MVRVHAQVAVAKIMTPPVTACLPPFCENGSRWVGESACNGGCYACPTCNCPDGSIGFATKPRITSEDNCEVCCSCPKFATTTTIAEPAKEPIPICMNVN